MDEDSGLCNYPSSIKPFVVSLVAMLPLPILISYD